MDVFPSEILCFPIRFYVNSCKRFLLDFSWICVLLLFFCVVFLCIFLCYCAIVFIYGAFHTDRVHIFQECFYMPDSFCKTISSRPNVRKLEVIRFYCLNCLFSLSYSNFSWIFLKCLFEYCLYSHYSFPCSNFFLDFPEMSLWILLVFSISFFIQ